MTQMRNFASPSWEPPLAARSLVNIDRCKDELISESNRIEIGNAVPFMSSVSWNQVGKPRIYHPIVVNQGVAYGNSLHGGIK